MCNLPLNTSENKYTHIHQSVNICQFFVLFLLFSGKSEIISKKRGGGFFFCLYKDIDSKYYLPTLHILLLYFTVLASGVPLATNTAITLKAEHFTIAVHVNLGLQMDLVVKTMTATETETVVEIV